MSSDRRAQGDDYGYHPHAREAICSYVAREGTVAGAPGLDPGDEADAEIVFEGFVEPGNERIEGTAGR